MAKIEIENDEGLDFGHEDFLKVGWWNSVQPVDEWGWKHLLAGLPLAERVQSKLREKYYKEQKWG